MLEKSLTKLGFFGKVLAGLDYLHFWTGVNFFRSLSYSRWLLNPNSIFWRNFVYQALAISFNFPAKKLRKIRALKIRMRHFFKFVSIGCSKWSNFPAKRLGKIRAPKIRMRRFFKFFKVNFYFTNSLLFCVLKTSIFFVIFIVSLIKQFNIHIQQLFFIFVYILRLLAGKFGPICTEFPLATLLAKN